MHRQELELIERIYFEIDEFVKVFSLELKKKQLTVKNNSRGGIAELSISEIASILVYFHHSNYRTFKHYYNKLIRAVMKKEFPKTVSYSRFIQLMPRSLIYLFGYLDSKAKGKVSGISFIDSTEIKVCDNRRIHSNKVFKGIANRGKTSMGYFYGFKLHLITNDTGEIVSFALTKANCDDRNQNIIEILTRDLFGKLYGDRGYISQKLFEELYSRGIELITRLKKNMKNHLMNYFDKLILRKRAIIETINDQLKNIFYLEHSRHRSPRNFLVNLLSCLVAYSFAEKKPSLNLEKISNENLVAFI